ncbi:MAG: addiction module toxin RelE [Thermoanaerobaculia bacterium]|nr:addiction module toxin RelE [Thermoanaerobaculia bacterium]
MPKSWSSKDERQYEHIKESEKKSGRSTKRSKAIAAATVNKKRSSEGRTKTSGGKKRSSKKAASKEKTPSRKASSRKSSSKARKSSKKR